MYSVTPINVPAVPLPPVLLATPLPNTLSALRVPATDVAPSFTNEQVRNDARGAPQLPLQVEAEAQPAAGNGVFPAPPPGPQANATAQTNFLAQLIGQDSSPQAIVYLAQYEKLLAFSDVKYKPSNAGKPQPAGLFDKLLRAGGLKQPAQPIVLNPQANSAPPPEAAAPQETAAPVAQSFASYRPDPALELQRAAQAYVAVVARNTAELGDAPPPDNQASTTPESNAAKG